MKVYACFLKESSPQQQHEAAHRLLSLALKREYNIDEYTLYKGKLGKPYLKSYKDIKINLSHCKGLAVCAVGECTVGIDCESLRNVRERVVKRVCTGSEASEIEHSVSPSLTFTRLWTLKECFVKAVGRGISYPMRNAAFSLENATICTNVRGAFFRQWVLFGKYVISLCAAEPECEVSLKLITEKVLNAKKMPLL